MEFKDVKPGMIFKVKVKEEENKTIACILGKSSSHVTLMSYHWYWILGDTSKKITERLYTNNILSKITWDNPAMRWEQAELVKKPIRERRLLVSKIFAEIN